MNVNDQLQYGLPATADADPAVPSLLPLPRFAHLHLQHILSHPPDSVLFPFMHGLEGDNEAQNTFFASSSTSPPLSPPPHDSKSTAKAASKTAKVPRYRGLVWVVCEDDLEAEPRRYARELNLLRRRRDGDADGLGTPTLEGDSESGSSDFDEEEAAEVVASPVGEHSLVEAQVDVVPPDAMDIDDAPRTTEAIHIGAVEHKDKEKHMHPVVQRPAPIQTTNLASSYSSSSSGLSTSLTTSDGGSFTYSPLSVSPTTTPDVAPLPISKPILTTPPQPNPTTSQSTFASKPIATTIAPAGGMTSAPELALLTCTFRPSEILRPVQPNPTPAEAQGTDGWEFVPAKVPDGISLRNFGIQVPIYTTISDIVVYSPKGPTPNAHILARRIQEAIRRKYEERAQRLGGVASDDGCYTHPDLLHYNVFILDATAADIQADTGVPHLVTRLCGNGVPGAGPFELGSPMGSSESGSLKDGDRYGAYTDGPDGHIVDMEAIEGEIRRKSSHAMYVDVDTDMDLEPPLDADVAAHARSQFRAKARARDSNTVDFAQREKEEMRDLTKASEIISVLPPDGMEGHAHHVITPPPIGPPAIMSMQSLQPKVWASHVGQVFLGNSDDVPLAPELPNRFRPASMGLELQGTEGDVDDPFNYLPTNDPAKGFGYDICIECHDLAPFPSPVHMKAAEEHLATLDELWLKRVLEKRRAAGEDTQIESGTDANANVIPPRPPPNANAVIHLPFPSSPSNTPTSMLVLMPVIRFLEKWLMPVVTPPLAPAQQQPAPPPPQAPQPSTSPSRRWSSVSSLMPHFPSFPLVSSSAPPPASMPPRTRSFTSPAGAHPNAPLVPTRTRPIKVLLYSADGYTESSVPALCLLMAVKRLNLPEAYLELQVTRRRSFFVYQADIGLLRRVEGRLREDAERSRVERERIERERVRVAQMAGDLEAHVNGNGKRVAASGPPPVRQSGWGSVVENAFKSVPPPRGIPPAPSPSQQQQIVPQPSHAPMGRPAAKSVSFSHGPPHSVPLVTPSSTQSYGEDRFTAGSVSAQQTQPPLASPKGRPRANTSPWLPSLIGDHQSWFNDPRFDGSFPSRVLPFLYLGNLNHAANVFMLHALGITHVVSVGECALIPPPHHVQGHGHYGSLQYHQPGSFHHGKGTGHGSLWHEEREGRIKVLDIKGVCDDGIDTLEPQLEPICDWIDQARIEGGQVLVHCRVGVSRSATVTIAYVMKHLGLPLVDAYLIVRSRRLSVLIQPNMRLLYNLCGWEIKLAKARAGDNEENLRNELAKTLSWPYLAKEVHALNEKYLH
ncbi:hypothetical protein H0H87_005957 [Tephrocybe sp. NHM501043]|nr:hypothetical protein H0H87_005957 [Tephrocybe sp. NHM501043]